MKKVHGISTSFSSFEDGNWYDSDDKIYHPAGWGVKFDIVIGKMIRPVPCFWKKGFWRGEESYNPWKGGQYWFIIRVPIMIGPWLSVAVGRYGFYLGTKVFQIAPHHTGTDRYGKWLKEGEAGTDREPAEYLQLSVSVRRSRWK